MIRLEQLSSEMRVRRWTARLLSAVLVLGIVLIVGCGGGGGSSTGSSSPGGGGGGGGNATLPTGDVYVTAGAGVARFDAANCSQNLQPCFLNAFATGIRPEGINGVAVGPDGNLYVALLNLFNFGVVARFDPQGNPLDCFVPRTDTQSCLVSTLASNLALGQVSDLTFGPDGNLYLASNNGVFRFNGSTGDPLNAMGGIPQPFFAGASGGYGFIAFSANTTDTALYLVTQIAPSVWRVDINTGVVIPVLTVFTGIALPSGIRIDPTGTHLFVVNNQEQNGPGGGSVILAEIDRYDLNAGNAGNKVTFVQAMSGGLGAASNLIFGNDNNLYVLDSSSSRILVYDGSTGAFIRTFATVPVSIGFLPVYIAFNPPK